MFDLFKSIDLPRPNPTQNLPSPPIFSPVKNLLKGFKDILKGFTAQKTVVKNLLKG